MKIYSEREIREYCAAYYGTFLAENPQNSYQMFLLDCVTSDVAGHLSQRRQEAKFLAIESVNDFVYQAMIIISEEYGKSSVDHSDVEQVVDGLIESFWIDYLKLKNS